MLQLIAFLLLLTTERPGFVSHGGWMLPDFDGREFGIEYLRGDAEGIVVFQVLESRREDGSAVWKTLDEKKLKVREGDDIVFGGICKRDGTDDPEIVVIGKQDEEGKVTIRTALRANRSAKRLEVISAKGLQCESELGGD